MVKREQYFKKGSLINFQAFQILKKQQKKPRNHKKNPEFEMSASHSIHSL